MKTVKYVNFTFLFFVALYSQLGKNISAQTQQNYVPGQILIKFSSGSLDSLELEKDASEFPVDAGFLKRSQHLNKITQLNVSKMRRVIEKMRPHHKYSLSRSGYNVPLPDLYNLMLMEVPMAVDIPHACKELSLLPGIQYAEPNYINSATDTPNDQYFGSQKSFEQTSNHDINATTAWNYSVGSYSVRIGIVDSGIDYNHPDLGGGLGTKVFGGHDYVDNDADPMDGDATGISHGTSVAGIVGALRFNNQTGVAGLAGGDMRVGNVGCQLYAFRVVNQALFGSTSLEAQAIVDASVGRTFDGQWGFKCDVLNNSYSGTQYNETLRAAVSVAAVNNVVFVAASGNDGAHYGPNYPAGYDDNWTIAVGASDENDNRAIWFAGNGSSTYGVGLDIVAPGADPSVSQQIYTTKKNNSYGTFGKTSGAAPHVTGVAALMRSVNPNLWTEDIEGIIRASAAKVHPDVYTYNQNGWNEQVGYGRLDAGKAMEMLQGPWLMDHYTAVGGTTVSTSSTFNMTFTATPQLFPGQYRVKRYQVQKTVSFPERLEAHAWGSAIQAQLNPPTYVYGLSKSEASYNNTNYGLGYTNVPSYTGFTAMLETYVYEVWSIDGNTYYGFVPTSPQNIHFAYTVLGKPVAPLTVSLTANPSTAPSKGALVTLTANTAGGTGSYSYSWVGASGSGTTATTNVTMCPQTVTVTVTSGSQTAPLRSI